MILRQIIPMIFALAAAPAMAKIQCSERAQAEALIAEYKKTFDRAKTAEEATQDFDGKISSKLGELQSSTNASSDVGNGSYCAILRNSQSTEKGADLLLEELESVWKELAAKKRQIEVQIIEVTLGCALVKEELAIQRQRARERLSTAIQRISAKHKEYDQKLESALRSQRTPMLAELKKSGAKCDVSVTPGRARSANGTKTDTGPGAGGSGSTDVAAQAPKTEGADSDHQLPGGQPSLDRVDDKYCGELEGGACVRLPGAAAGKPGRFSVHGIEFDEHGLPVTDPDKIPKVDAKDISNLEGFSDRRLGRSEHADILQGKVDGKEVVVKAFGSQEKALREAALHKVVNGEGLGPQLYGVTELPDGRYGVVTEKLAGGALIKCTIQCGAIPGEGRQLSEFKIGDHTYAQIIEAEAKLRAAGVSPNDLQFLVNEKGDVRLVDPGDFRASDPAKATPIPPRPPNADFYPEFQHSDGSFKTPGERLVDGLRAQVGDTASPALRAPSVEDKIRANAEKAAGPLPRGANGIAAIAGIGLMGADAYENAGYNSNGTVKQISSWQRTVAAAGNLAGDSGKIVEYIVVDTICAGCLSWAQLFDKNDTVAQMSIHELRKVRAEMPDLTSETALRVAHERAVNLYMERYAARALAPMRFQTAGGGQHICGVSGICTQYDSSGKVVGPEFTMPFAP